MRTLVLAHILLVSLIAPFSLSPIGVSSSLAPYPSEFDGWVDYIKNTCHPDGDEDVEDDDHLPGRPTGYKDEVFAKWVKVKKGYGYKKGVGKYGHKRSLMVETDVEPRFIQPSKGLKHKEKKGVKGKPDKKDKGKDKKSDVKGHKGSSKTPPPSSSPNSSVSQPPAAAPFPSNPDAQPPFPSSPPLPASKTGGKLVVVAKDGSGDFTTVQAAINSVPVNNKKRIVIFVKKGIYREKVLIPASKPFITLKGEAAALTYIQWGDTASTLGKNGQPLSTYGSASVAIDADDFIALDISFKNTAPPPPAGAVGKQGVALRIDGDRGAFYRCSFYGAQDTLYDRLGRHYYYKCYLEGSIDFIFGDARSLFVKCHIHSIAAPFGSIAAQKRLTPTENTGYSFAYCIVTGTGTIYLGRAWGAYSRIVYAFTYFDNIITPVGWSDWNIPANDKTVFYGEYKCYGPGANTSGRAPWSKQLTAQQAKPFLSTAFIDGKQWLVTQ